jgi:signal transduction histidine kinase/CheY-like chemotaxis protein
MSAAISIHSNWMMSFIAFSFPALGGVIVRLFADGGSANSALAMLLMLLLGVAYYIASKTHHTMRETLALRFENLNLLDELRLEKDRAEQANRDKTRFLASASHDLRQPVHSLALFNEALANEVSEPRASELISYSARAIHSLNELLGSLLDISKLDAGVVTPQCDVFPLQSLLDDIVAELAVQADERGLELRLRPCRVMVNSDPSLLADILRNLIINAIRYTDRGGVLIGCRRRGDTVWLQVWDSGHGIPPEEQDRVFKEFHQLSNPERDRSKGLGLGLAICRRLAILLGHRLVLRSVAGRGTVFTVILPISSEQSKDAAAPLPIPLVANLNGSTILVVDDEESVRLGMQAFLTRWGVRVELADGLEEALASCRTHPPQLIISDYRLRGSDGLAVIEAVRAVVGSPVPALMVTGDTDPQRIREAKASGHLLLHKPVAPGQLRSAIQELLKNASR